MPLSWNEIKSRALAFSREWQDKSSEDAEAERVAFLFERYQKLTSLLPAASSGKGEKTRGKIRGNDIFMYEAELPEESHVQKMHSAKAGL